MSAKFSEPTPSPSTNISVKTTVKANLSGHTTESESKTFNGVPVSYGEDKNYVHNQIAPSQVWTVIHNLQKHPAVSVVDSSGEVVIGDVLYLDENTVELRFNGEFSGKAYFN